MEHPKRNRGARSGWPLAVPRTLIASLALVGAVALPGLSWGQAGCGGGIANDFDLTATPPANLRFVDDTLRVKATVFNVNNQTWTVDEFVHKLDCDNAGSFDSCVDDGAVLGFVGYVSTTCQDASDVGVSWTPTVVGNQVSFAPSSPVVLDPFQLGQFSCDIFFDVNILALSSDSSVNVITGANHADGACATGPGSANGSISTPVQTCGITLEKQVYDPGADAWLAADNAINGDGEDLLQVIFKDADPISTLDTGDVQYRLVVTNTSSVAMPSVLVSDTALGIPDTEVGPLTAGQEKTVTSGDISALNALERCLESGNLENTSSATGICRASAPVVDEDASNNAWVQCIGVPDIDIKKEVSLDGSDWRDANLSTDADVPEGVYGADAYYRITVTNNGSVDLENVVVNDATLGITDYLVGDLAVGASVVLVQGDIAELFVEDRCNARGNYANLASTTGASVEDGTQVTDTDPANIRCVGEPDIQIVKEISVDDGTTWGDANAPGDLDTPTVEAPSGALYRFTVTNIGNFPLVNLVVADSELGIDPTPIPGTLEPGASVVIGSGEIPALNVAERCDHGGTFINTASATANPIDKPTDPAEAVTDDDPATLICTGDDLCLTRTPGFWGTHPHVTELFLDIEVCGLPIEVTDAGTSNSSAEAMCTSGQDAKQGTTNMHYLQLVRQLTAAKLNIAASATNEGTCDTVGGVDIDALIERCEAAALCGDTGAKAGKLIAASGCIEQLDAFNNSEDTLDVFGPFVTPGPADPTECQEANGNNVVVK